MKNKARLLLLLALLLSLAIPLLVPSGAMLYDHKSRLLEETWDMEEDEAEEGGLINWLLPRASAEALTEYTLPFDFSPGPPPDPAAFSPDGYVDDSIEVRLETLEQDGVVYRIAHVLIAHPSQLRTATAGKPTSSRVALISSMAYKNNAVIAISANYMANDPAKTSFEYRMGEKVRSKLNRSKDLLIIDEQADFHLFVKSKKEEVDAFLNEGHQIINAFTFGPALVKDGELLKLDSKYSFNPQGDEPRLAIGQIAPFNYVLVLAEGRLDNSRGVSHQELAEFMFDIGCMQAFNMDGGNSATMVFNGGYYQNKSVNNERAQSDMIYFATGVVR